MQNISTISSLHWVAYENSNWTNESSNWTNESSTWTSEISNWTNKSSHWANGSNSSPLLVFRDVVELGYGGITFVLLLSLFLIAFNSILLHTILSNRHKEWAKRTKHIRYLIISDLVAALNLFWSALLRFRNVPYWQCAIKIYLSSSTQVVSYYHMLAVCIHRFRKLSKVDLPHGTNDKYRYGIESLVIWMVVLLLSVPPFVISARNEDLPVCHINVLFRPHLVMSIYGLILCCLPCFLTNVLYGAVLWKMRVCINAIQPVNYTVHFRNTQNATDTERVTIQQQSNPTVSITSANKVNKVIGYLLLVFNISVLAPIISNALMLAGYEGVWTVWIQILTYVNNIFSPFIYSLSIGPLRRELVSTLGVWFFCVRTIITCTYAQN